MDAALELAEQTSPDVVIANDPDADRCAVAVPGPGGWRMLRGDEVGRAAGLARAVARRRRRGAARLGRLRLRELDRVVAAARGDVPGGRGAPRGDAHRLQVDRPGAGAALRLRGGPRLLRRPGPGARQGRRVGRAARRRARRDAAGRGPVAHRPARRPGPRARGVRDRRLLGAGRGPLRSSPRSWTGCAPTPLTSVAGVDVARVDDLARGDGGLPPTEGLRYFLADDSRVIVRPSGTEPKLKVYLEVVEPVGAGERAARTPRACGPRGSGRRPGWPASAPTSRRPPSPDASPDRPIGHTRYVPHVPRSTNRSLEVRMACTPSDLLVDVGTPLGWVCGRTGGQASTSWSRSPIRRR